MNNKLEIIKGMDCWGSISYFGYKNGKQYTEDHWSITDLIECYPEFKNAIVKFKGNNDYSLENSQAGKWKFKIIEGMDLITESIIEQIQDFKDNIYFNDLSSRHWIFDFKINNVWIEAKEVNCNTMTMDLILFQ